MRLLLQRSAVLEVLPQVDAQRRGTDDYFLSAQIAARLKQLKRESADRN